MADNEYHGYEGSLNVQNVDILSPHTFSFFSANMELGRNITDYNGKDQMGVSLLQMTTNKGRRVSGNKAFLRPVRNRWNLKLLTRTLALKLLIRGNIVEGVRYLRNSRVYCAFATKEVILSAGAINTPQLLMLSGIGPKDHLKELGIQVIKDLPVGENMWDHITFEGPAITFNGNLKEYTIKEQVQQYLNGNGYLTTLAGVQDIGFTSLYWDRSDQPDIEHLFRVMRASKKPYEAIKNINNLKRDVYESLITPIDGQILWQVLSVLLHPKSRGTVRLQSNSPLDFPLIDSNYFSDPEESDLNTLAAAFRDILQMAQTNTVESLGGQVVDRQIPGCEDFIFGTDEYIKCLAKHLTKTLYHNAGTCKMGPSTDKTSVVADDLKVHGIRSLRVVDCSVIPVTTSGHTNAVAYMIAEKAADLIKNNWY